ncbi:acyltransferase family protein [Roseobacter sinensis]|uniref:Acyltransferase n=1 Tax=Roseobacter sinensis TaxID=2931391 RepID=A0ABT3BKV6_9RHOB|nr:acyltransferase [Roseobacter sp. WL0113]MCV3273734.1 acyltransferase [Roseobacter sp. WL0113]
MAFTHYIPLDARSDPAVVPIETMRAIAVILLVSYHVIGVDAGNGLQAGYPHPLRVVSDFFIDVRMPVFAFLAGYIYAIRPPDFRNYAKFCLGKFRRIYVPGIIASLIFAVCAFILQNRFAMPVDEIWRVIFFSYAHFWFLQAIFVIFILFGLVDAVLDKRFTWVIFIGACLAYLMGLLAGRPFLSLQGAHYIFPYFLAGVIVYRNIPLLNSHSTAAMGAALALMAAGGGWNALIYYETGALSQMPRDLQSLMFGIGFCLFAVLRLTRASFLEKICPYAFTIYLYHPFGTSGMRMLSDKLGFYNDWLQFALGLATGIALPIALHLAASRIPVISRMILGR